MLGSYPTLDRYLSAIQEVLILDCALVEAALALPSVSAGAVQEAASGESVRAVAANGLPLSA